VGEGAVPAFPFGPGMHGVMRLRTESKGTSPVRASELSSSFCQSPALAAATTMAPSVGSPTMR